VHPDGVALLNLHYNIFKGCFVAEAPLQTIGIYFAVIHYKVNAIHIVK